MKELFETIKADQAEILEFTRELVAIATENPPGKFYKKCVDVIATKLSGFGLDYKIIKIPHQGESRNNKEFPRYCILGSYGKGDKVLYFHGHYDVVPSQHKNEFLKVPGIIQNQGVCQ